MRYLHLLIKFFRSNQKLLLIEASFWLALARLLILYARYPVQTSLLGKQSPNHMPTGSECSPRAKQIGHAVRLAAKHLPWQCKCLAQAMAAQSMLRRRRIAGVVYIGVNKATYEYKAHAWLKVGDCYLTGGNGFKTYYVIDCYMIDFGNKNQSQPKKPTY